VVEEPAPPAAQAEIVVEGEPPPPPSPEHEVVAASPGAEFVWVPGYHRWDGHRYIWIHGRYERRPHANARWTGAHWEARGHSHVWIEGNWEGQAAVAPAAPAPAAPAGAHPWYLHALSDLREARANLERKGGDKQMKWDEHDGVGAIDRAIKDIKTAALDDGKKLEDHPPVDAHEPRGGRLHKALAALQTARADIDKEEDNAFANGLRARASHDIDEAIRFTEAGVQAAAAEGPAVVAAAPAAPPPTPAAAHPWYLHALSDLREARANLERKGGDKQMKWDEHDGVGAIDRAIKDIKTAALDDGKNLDDHPAVDAHEPRGGRLHKALSALQTARADIDKEEDNAFANGLRARASHDIDEAIRFTEAGVQAAAAEPAVAAAPVAPAAPPAAAHPAYLRALADLRNARANLERKGGDKQMKWDERDAVVAIDRAIKDIKEAALDDGKNLEDHPAVDAHEPRGGRLHKALAALQAARGDIEKEEDNAFANGLRARANHDIDEAIHATEAGVQAAASAS
jgi:ribosomal protein L12E/L44/L45/RPP1/RPP2